MNKKTLQKIIGSIIFILPFFIGFFGYLPVHDYSISWAAYSAIRLYVANVDTYDLNPLVDLARWSALLVVASGLLLAIRTTGTALINYCKCFSPKSCAVYGSSPFALHLLKDLGRHGIASTGKVIHGAKEQVLLFDTDEENLSFLIANTQQLEKTRITIKLDKVIPHCLSGDNITAFSIAENCARVYWRKYPIISNEKVAIIGFEALGQEILTCALQVNLFSLDQKIEYHIWGDSTCFRGLHTEMSKIDMDKIIYHEDDWQTDFMKEESFDRVIFCTDYNDDLINLSIILSYAQCSKIHVYMDSPERLTCFNSDTTTIEAFGTVEEMATRDIVLKESLLDDAKKLHKMYSTKYPSLGPWENLSGFKKRSNISAVDYGAVIRNYINPPPLEELANLEKIRWNRFHYINNWTYSPERDDTMKKHNLLKPFNEISEAEKQKDRDNIEYYLS